MQKVWVYYNVRRKQFSVRCNGKVVAHTDHVVLADARFRVSQSGRQRVLQSGHKNVHAYIVGYLSDKEIRVCHDDLTWGIARYNPYQTETFVDTLTGEPVRSAPFVSMSVSDGRPIVGYML